MDFSTSGTTLETLKQHLPKLFSYIDLCEGCIKPLTLGNEGCSMFSLGDGDWEDEEAVGFAFEVDHDSLINLTPSELVQYDESLVDIASKMVKELNLVRYN